MNYRLRFAYRLALQLGIYDVSRWLESLASGSLDGWMVYYSLEPWDKQAAFPLIETPPASKMMSALDAAKAMNGCHL